MKSIFFPKRGSSISKIKLDSKITKKQIPHNSFQKLKVTNDFNVVVVFSDTKEEISIEANDNLHEHIKYAYEEGTLSFNKTSSVKMKGKQILNIFITTKPFYEFRADDDATITVESLLISENISVKLTDDSKLIAKVDAENMDIYADDDCSVTLKGNVYRVKLRLKDDSEFNNTDFSVNHLEARLSGDSRAKITVNKSLKIKLTGDSEFKYKGSPVVEEKEVSGGSAFINIPS